MAGTTTSSIIEEAIHEELSSQVHRLETAGPCAQHGPLLAERPRDYYALAHAHDATEEAFRHSGWTDRRRRAAAALESTGMPPGRLDRFRTCGGSCYLQRRDDGQDVRLVAHYCHDRWCVACQTTRAAIIRGNLCRACNGRTVRFLTLTLRHSNTPLATQIDRLYRSFHTLRRRADWKQAVSTGVAFLELKVSDRDGLWHPHLHCVIGGTWLDVKELSRWWHEVTGDSSIVDLRRVESVEHLQRYVTKYVTKTVDGSVLRDSSKLNEAVEALHGRRMLLPFGDWQSVCFTENPESEHQWIEVAPLSRIIGCAADGQEWAIRWLEVIERKWGHLPGP